MIDQSYLHQHLFDSERLHRRAVTEFSAALRSGRLIAFVGSYATEDRGYGGWGRFLKQYGETALEKVSRVSGNDTRVERARRAIAAMQPSLDEQIDAVTVLTVIEYAFEYAEAAAKSGGLGYLDVDRAKPFGLTPRKSGPSIVRTLLDELGVDRVITLNYDLEFEWEWMTTLDEKKVSRSKRGRAERFDEILADGRIQKEVSTKALSRVLPNGRSVLSDIFMRERTDRLIEFAVGSPDYEGHVFHLHGRVTDPETMVVSSRDYDRQYRRSGVTKLPFEHALRILFAGNPILLFGVGMTEREVTATLEQFVSDHPNRRFAPTFVLWSPRPQDDKYAIAFRWYHRFGLLTLFDEDLPGYVSRPNDFIRLANSLRLASKAGNRPPFNWISERDHQDNLVARRADPQTARVFPTLRSSRSKLDRAGEHVDVWSTTHTDRDTAPTEAIARAIAADKPVLLFIAEPGTGKGDLAQRLRSAWHQRPTTSSLLERRSCVVNASFVFETDSLFSLISGLDNDLTADLEPSRPLSRAQSLLKYVKQEEDDRSRELLLVINGMERFFGPDGAPLSCELDALLRGLAALAASRGAMLQAAAKAATCEGATAAGEGPLRGAGVAGEVDTADPSPWPYTLYILGTPRVRRYFNALSQEARTFLFSDKEEFCEEHLALPELARSSELHTRSAYLDKLVASMGRGLPGAKGAEPSSVQKALIRAKADRDRNGVRRAVLAAYLQPEMLKDAGVEHPDLALELLTAMAFIGQPIEACIGAYAPKVAERLRQIVGNDTERFAATYRATVQQLSDLGLLIQITSFPNSPPSWTRYGLHRAVLAEMRDRLGVPLTDAQLSSGFNLSILAAEPADGYGPERDNHQDLARLVDWLIGAYTELPLDGYAAIEDPEDDKLLPPDIREFIAQTMSPTTPPPEETAVDLRRAWPHAAACLRAALSLIRSYYSTATLLTLGAGADDDGGVFEDGPLTQHADRLSRLLAAARANAEARTAAATRLSERGQEQWLGAPPFYADDLVWLHNELGVVKLAQGDLYEARYAFDEALRLNGLHIEFQDRSHNWRRIMLNQVHVDIERGQLDRAESRMAQIEEAIAGGEPIDTVRSRITRRYGRATIREKGAVDPDFPHDVVLSVGLIYGFRGLCQHLRGHLRASDVSFRNATTILDNIGERRAYAMFQRHYGSLLSSLKSPDTTAALRLALAAADATRQADIAQHARISLAWYGQASADDKGRAALMRQLQQALMYAERSDMHRVRVEAGINLARVKFVGGDHDAALEHAADAMATAVRYGLSLRKISLRILIGQILIRRGDPKSGRALLEKAIRNADRITYQRAVELAQNVLVSEAAL